MDTIEDTSLFQTDLIKELQDQKFALDQAAIVARTDASGRILYVNAKFCEISGYTAEELIGQNHRILNSGHHDRIFFRSMWSSISNGRIWKGEICNRKKNGDLYWVATTIVPFCDHEGKAYQFLAIRQDITELKTAQKTILDQQAKLVLASRLSAIGEMSAAITHEINNPLGVILGRTEMLKSMLVRGAIDKESLMRVVESIEVTGKRIEKIVKSMRSLGHHSEDEPFYPTRLKEMLGDTLDLCSQRFRNFGIEVYFQQVPEDLTIECRSHEIVQVLVNLLNNAYDAAQEKDSQEADKGLSRSAKWVRISYHDLGPEVLISVSDSGTGLPEAVQEKIFSPFFSTKKVQYGTGLGLGISRNIAFKHHGSLKYDPSAANTTFLLTLPKKHVKKA